MRYFFPCLLGGSGGIRLTTQDAAAPFGPSQPQTNAAANLPFHPSHFAARQGRLSLHARSPIPQLEKPPHPSSFPSQDRHLPQTMPEFNPVAQARFLALFSPQSHAGRQDTLQFFQTLLKSAWKHPQQIKAQVFHLLRSMIYGICIKQYALSHVLSCLAQFLPQVVYLVNLPWCYSSLTERLPKISPGNAVG